MNQKQKEERGYYEAVGRRKTARARVRIREGTRRVTVNTRLLREYFSVSELQHIVTQPLEKLGIAGMKIEVQTTGGGIRGQAEAIRHGLARALIKKDPSFRPLLKAHGFLTRDARAKERRKFGLKKARRAPQWAKR